MTPDHPSPARRLLELWSRTWGLSARSRRWLFRGTLSSALYVGARLALPFPIKNLAKPWLGGKAEHLGPLFGWGGMDPALEVGGALLVLLAVLGFTDYHLRLCFARYAIGTMRDARNAALRGIRQREVQASLLRPGDLISRLIGDIARAKAGFKSFLIHVVTNAVYLVGVLVVLSLVSGMLGLLLLATFVVLAVVVFVGARSSTRIAHRYRRKEGKLADRIQRSLGGSYGDKSMKRLNKRSGSQEARLTWIQGRCTWATHLLLGLLVFAAMLLGSRQMAAGRLDGSDLLLFLLYAMMLRAPLVKVVRQCVKAGKAVACLERIFELCDPPATAPSGLPPLRSGVQLEGIKVTTKKVEGLRRRRLGPLDLALEAGSHVLLVGKAGAGKTTLLRLLAGLDRARRGRILWDGQPIRGPATLRRSPTVHYLPPNPTWNRTSLGGLVFVDGTGALPRRSELKSILGRFGAVRTARRRCPTWESPLGSADLSPAEAQSLGLLRALRSPASVLLLDDPFTAMTKKQRAAAWAAIAGREGLVLVAVRSADAAPEGFGRIVRMRKGRIVDPPAAVDPSATGGETRTWE